METYRARGGAIFYYRPGLAGDVTVQNHGEGKHAAMKRQDGPGVTVFVSVSLEDLTEFFVRVALESPLAMQNIQASTHRALAEFASTMIQDDPRQIAALEAGGQLEAVRALGVNCYRTEDQPAEGEAWTYTAPWGCAEVGRSWPSERAAAAAAFAAKHRSHNDPVGVSFSERETMPAPAAVAASCICEHCEQHREHASASAVAKCSTCHAHRTSIEAIDRNYPGL